MKKSLFLSLFALLLVATGCKKEVESVKVMPGSIILSVGETYQLQSVVKPDKAPQEVRWVSSNPEVATVSANGLVTAVAAGECEISVYADVQKSTCRVKVTTNCIPVAGVTLDKISLTIAEGDVAQLIATVAPDNATNKNVSWLSSDNAVATVSSDGKVTAVKAGTSTITVTTEDGSKTAICAVTVKSGLPEGALPGEFSVSATKKVHFSKGNLVATINASGAPTAWKFAANQYDCLGEGGANKTIGSAAGDVDLFGWSTASTTYGISTSTSSGDYSGDFVDWGKNMGDGNTWRTLTTAEWQYLFDTRIVNGGTGAGKSYSLNITYGGKMGVVLYPDDYTGSVLSGTVDSLPEGVVFLPAAGSRYGSNVRDVGAYGYYWSSAAYDSFSACHVYFLSDGDFPDTFGGRSNGYSVRLITECQ